MKKFLLLGLLGVGLAVMSCSVSAVSDQASLPQVSGQTEAVNGTGPEVKLIDAYDDIQRYHGMYSHECYFVVRVKNISYAKQVFIHHLMADGTWYDMPLTYSHPSGNGYETWTAYVSSSYGLNDFGSQFAVKYVVNGQTYWDNNNGANYTLDADMGPLLGRSINVSAYRPYVYSLITSSNTNHYLYGSVDVRNLGYDKQVDIIYTTDNWQTTKVAAASYSGPYVYYGYSSFVNPNKYGIERWNFKTEIGASDTVTFAVSYRVNGVTYWDNNEGLNYTVQEIYY